MEDAPPMQPFSNSSQYTHNIANAMKVAQDVKAAKNAQDASASQRMRDARCELCCDLIENATRVPCCGKCFCRECILVGLISMKGNNINLHYFKFLSFAC